MNGDTDIRRSLGRIEGQLQSILTNQTAQTKAIASLEDRASSLERGRAWLTGAAAAIGAIASLLFHTFKG